MSFSDDDVAVIALWIIAIGFIILAIDKTTKLNNGIDQAAQLLPPVPVPEPQPPSVPSSGFNQEEDQQFMQIQKQLQQLGNGLNQLKKNLNQP